MARGGKRENSGRKAGVANSRSRAIALAAAEQGIQPVEVMLNNMRYWHESAENLAKRLRETVVDINDNAMLLDLMKSIDKLCAFRDRAEQCAVDAAPYIHPRLAAITVKGDAENPLAIVLKDMKPKEAAEAYASAIGS